MILVTGAAGKTGQAVIKALSTSAKKVRALVRRPEQMPVVQNLGCTEVLAGNMTDPSALRQAVNGCTSVYHICPNMNPDEVSIGQKIINASLSAGVQHFVYHSVLHPQVEAMPHHWLKMRVEEMLFQSGLVFTILQPAAYMQNILSGWNSIIEQGIYSVPYAVETRMSMVNLEDIAEAAGIILTQDGHQNAIYELCGLEILTQVEVAQVLTAELGRPVTARAVSRAEWARDAKTKGIQPGALETLLKMFVYYEQYGFCGNSKVLEWLLKRKPTCFAEFVRMQAEK